MSNVVDCAYKKPSSISRLPRISRVLLIACGISLLGCMALSTSYAWAGQARLLTGVFGTATTAPLDPYPLAENGDAGGVAVDTETHDVYVVDPRNNRVEKFDSTGHFILMFGKEVDRTTGGNVCTALSGDICQAGVQGVSPGAFEFNPIPNASAVDGVAVDNSGVFGQQGNVYVSGGPVVSKFDSEGNLISSWGNNGEGSTKNGPANGQLNGSNATGAVSGPFGLVRGIGVDPSGNLWVDARGMFEFRPSSSFLSSWTSAQIPSQSIAFDSEGNLYMIGEHGLTKFSPLGTVMGVVEEEGAQKGLTADSVSNEVYSVAGGSGSNVVHRYDASCHLHIVEGAPVPCTPVETFGANQIQSRESMGAAIDPSTSADTLYLTEKSNPNKELRLSRVLAFSVESVPDVVTGKAYGFAVGSASLVGSVDPSGMELESGLAGCRFEWGEQGAGGPSYEHVVPCDKTAAQIGSGSAPVEVHATVSGLQQGHIYHFRLVAGNHNEINELIDEPSLGADLAFGPPTIESSSAVSVGAESATAQAEVNPNNVDTRIRLEYGTEAGVYGASTSEEEMGSGGSSQLASFQLLGLVSHTVYHYRFVAENALGEGAEAVVGPDRTFTTQSVENFALPDGRAWELVSPANKRGGSVLPLSEGGGLAQSSAAGDAFSYLVTAPSEAEPAGHTTATQILSRRTAGGWASQDIDPLHEGIVGTSLGYGGEYRFFSTDLSQAIVQQLGNFVPGLSPEASERTPYLRTNFPSGELGSPCVSSCYRPLVTGASGYENVPPGTIFGSDCKTTPCGPVFLGASPDLKHVVVSSEAALVEGAPSSKPGSFKDSLYEWSAGKLVLVSVPPGNSPANNILNLALGFQNQVARNAISNDGSRVVWAEVGGNLYVRDVTKEETVQVAGAGAMFQMASSDGSKVLFTEANDLRKCEIIESAGKLNCVVSDLSPAGAGENAGVQGLVPSASEDMSYVYFVAGAVLENNGVPVPGARSGDCNPLGHDETCNLYVNHDGAIKLVAELSPTKDKSDWDAPLEELTAKASSDGRWFAFMSDRSLTGYDNRDSVNGRPDAEVYLYDATANGGEGALVCASCNPTGVRPHGLIHSSGERSVYESVAAKVPGWTAYTLQSSLYQSRYLSNNGRLFFDSYDALVPQDSNGTGDVYEYEPAGQGNCTTASVTFDQSSGGCAGLISSGTSKEESQFLDASENGNDLFFMTIAQLSHTDTDSTDDVYDARISGGFSEPPLPPTCEGDACQSPFGAPEDPTPGSLTYSGPANPPALSTKTVNTRAKRLKQAQKLVQALAACKKNRSKRARTTCVRKARKRYGQAKADKNKAKKGKR